MYMLRTKAKPSADGMCWKMYELYGKTPGKLPIDRFPGVTLINDSDGR